MRRLALVLALVVAAAGITLFVRRDRGGPFPSTEHVRAAGFAAWPVDTVEEAERECDGAPEWRRDARRTALRFTNEVMRYPDPGGQDWSGDDPERKRFLVTTDGVRGVFLGSVIEVARFGHCWYVVDAEPREGEWPTATLAFVYRDDRPHLYLGNADEVPPGTVGYGGWETEVDPGTKATVIPIPEEGRDATGHAILLDPDDDGVSETAGVETLGVIPPAPQGAPDQPLEAARVTETRESCRNGSHTSQTPERIVKNLLRWDLVNVMRRAEGLREYERKSFRRLGGDRWRIVADRAVLDATIADTGPCYRLVSIEPAEGDPPLRRAWVDRGGVTAGLDWGGGDDAYLRFGTGFTGGGGTVRQIRAPLTFPWADGPPPADEPVYVLALLFKDDRIVSASYDLYPAASGS